MGNRAVITFSNKSSAPGIYLHWNGGPESVLAFLKVCDVRGYRDPVGDPQYALASLIGVIHEFFDGDSSVGVGPVDKMDVDNWDNGAYRVGAGWTIAERWGEGSDEAVTTVEHLTDAERKVYDGIVAAMTKKVAE